MSQGLHLLGLNNVCNFGRLKIWAERGLIHFEDTTTGHYCSSSVRTTLVRMRAISQMLANSREDMTRSGHMYSDEYDAHQKMLEEMVTIVEIAKAQGMPSDPVARRDLVARRPKTVAMPGLAGAMI